jgi:outer membrane protein assembly factor BamA
LPISERFFSGGSTTLRGFSFEEAGPREVVIPLGQFRDQDNNLVFLNPFTVPVGGNAVAVVNLEARVPLTRRRRWYRFMTAATSFAASAICSANAIQRRFRRATFWHS